MARIPTLHFRVVDGALVGAGAIEAPGPVAPPCTVEDRAKGDRERQIKHHLERLATVRGWRDKDRAAGHPQPTVVWQDYDRWEADALAALAALGAADHSQVVTP